MSFNKQFSLVSVIILRFYEHRINLFRTRKASFLFSIKHTRKRRSRRTEKATVDAPGNHAVDAPGPRNFAVNTPRKDALETVAEFRDGTPERQHSCIYISLAAPRHKYKMLNWLVSFNIC